MPSVFLGLGSNVGDRLLFLSKAVQELQILKEANLKVISSIYETEPVGYKEQGDFLNFVIELETNLEIVGLVRQIKTIERKVGKKAAQRWGPREIDIDLLLYNDAVYHNREISVPHPQMTERKFVLIPFNEIAPLTLHPEKRKKISELLLECKDTSRVVKTDYQLMR